MGEKTPCYSKLDRKGFPLPWIPSNSLVKKVRGEITALCAAEANNTAKKKPDTESMAPPRSSPRFLVSSSVSTLSWWPPG